MGEGADDRSLDLGRGRGYGLAFLFFLVDDVDLIAERVGFGFVLFQLQTPDVIVRRFHLG